MQRATNLATSLYPTSDSDSNVSHLICGCPSATTAPTKSPRLTHLTLALLTVGMLGLSGCQTIKSLTGKDSDAIVTAAKSDAAYYQEAVTAMEKGNYVYATEQLGELRTFYPTGVYAEQALLDLMYSQFQSKEYELAAASAEQFMKLYPRNIQVDYAYYVRGVANMQAGNSTLLHLAHLKQAHRDTAYLRLAFNNFQELVARYPNSAYTPDAALRMSYIYNQLAESELEAARWYIKRDAYVAAANRAKWVFQFYPLSEQTPEAIAILAYSHEQLGLADLAQKYKTLLQINYPEWLGANGEVAINRSSGWLNRLTFGQLGRSVTSNAANASKAASTYTGPTTTQIIQQAAQLQLPDDTDNAAIAPMQTSLATLANSRNGGINVGLALPEEDNRPLSSPSTSNRSGAATIPVSPQTLYPAAPPLEPSDAGSDSSTSTNLPRRTPTAGTAATNADTNADVNTNSTSTPDAPLVNP